MKQHQHFDAFYQRRNILGVRYHPMQEPFYSDICTFMRAPLVDDLNEADIGVIGIPYDGGVTGRPGARHGPRGVRNQSSMMRAVNTATGVAPYERARIADLGDVQFREMFNIENTVKDIERYYDAIADADVLPLGIGGDHSVTYPILKALRRKHKRPLALIHVDSHTDTWPEYQGSGFHHGAPFRLASEEGLIDPLKTVHIGIRGGHNMPYSLDYTRDKGMRVFSIEEFEDTGWNSVAEGTCRIVDGNPTYLTFDIDALDPAFAPGTGTPEAGGLSTREAQRLLRKFWGLNFVGGDIVEIAPPFDVGGITTLNGATIAFEMLCVLSGRFGSQ